MEKETNSSNLNVLIWNKKHGFKWWKIKNILN